jgi:hypothetical protein
VWMVAREGGGVVLRGGGGEGACNVDGCKRGRSCFEDGGRFSEMVAGGGGASCAWVVEDRDKVVWMVASERGLCEYLSGQRVMWHRRFWLRWLWLRIF